MSNDFESITNPLKILNHNEWHILKRVAIK